MKMENFFKKIHEFEVKNHQNVLRGITIRSNFFCIKDGSIWISQLEKLRDLKKTLTRVKSEAKKITNLYFIKRAYFHRKQNHSKQKK